MKMEIIEPNSKGEFKFPLFARCRDNKKVIVLFTDKTSGMAVSQTNIYSIGYYSTSWNNVFGSSWEILPAGTEIKFIQE